MPQNDDQVLFPNQLGHPLFSVRESALRDPDNPEPVDAFFKKTQKVYKEPEDRLAAYLFLVKRDDPYSLLSCQICDKAMEECNLIPDPYTRALFRNEFSVLRVERDSSEQPHWSAKLNSTFSSMDTGLG